MWNRLWFRYICQWVKFDYWSSWWKTIKLIGAALSILMITSGYIIVMCIKAATYPVYYYVYEPFHDFLMREWRPSDEDTE